MNNNNELLQKLHQINLDKQAHLVPENIRKGVTALGVTGTLEEVHIVNQDKTITENGTFEADEGYTGLGVVVVDVDTVKNQDKTVEPKVTSQDVVPDEGFTGLGKVTVEGVTNDIDSNISPENIRKDVSILGVTGNLEEIHILNQDKSVQPSTSEQTVTADEGYTGLGTVSVGAVTSAIDTNIKPENIKKNVPILGVVGTLEQSSSGGGGGVTLFASMEEMNANNTASIGDLAVVYGTQMKKLTSTDAFSSLTFPSTVVLEEAVADYYSVYGSCYGAVYADVQGMIDPTMAEMYIYTDTGGYNITYTSADGKTYTRTDTGEDMISFGASVQMDWMEWNDIFGEFMQMGGYVFEGLFEYGDYVNEDVYEAFEFTSEANGNLIPTTMDVSKIKALIPKVLETTPAVLNGQTIRPSGSWVVRKISDTEFELYAGCTYNSYYSYYMYGTEGFYRQSDGNWYLCLGAYVHRSDYVVVDTLAELKEYDRHSLMIRWDVDTAAETVVATQLMSSAFTAKTLNTYTKYISTTPITGSLLCTAINYDEGEYSSTAVPFGTPSISGTDGIAETSDVIMQKYLVAKSQLDATADYVYDKNFIGKNGAETGTLGATENVTAEGLQLKVNLWNAWSEIQTDAVSLEYAFSEYTGEYMPKLITPNLKETDGMFYDAAALKEISLFDTSNVISASYMFRGCQALEVLPAFDFGNCINFENMFANCYALKNIPDLDTSKATNFWYMFQNCTGLEAVPNIDTSKGTKLKGMFRNCKALTTIPVLDTTSTTDVDYLIQGCDNLSSEGLNNAMQICVNIGSEYSATKTLKSLGMSETQAATAQTLSNWSTLSSLGWTTGY